MDPQRHVQAAARHDAAAESHDRLAKQWQERGDAERALLQHELAEHERRGATLERRWAAIIVKENDAAAARQAAS
jgi:hypothetical protein